MCGGNDDPSAGLDEAYWGYGSWPVRAEGVEVCVQSHSTDAVLGYRKHKDAAAWGAPASFRLPPDLFNPAVVPQEEVLVSAAYDADTEGPRHSPSHETRRAAPPGVDFVETYGQDGVRRERGMCALVISFVCTICGRRFGVASNLNRHTRRCAARPVNGLGASAPRARALTATSSASAADPHTDTMAREATSPDVWRVAHKQEARDGDLLPLPWPDTPPASTSVPTPASAHVSLSTARHRARTSARLHTHTSSAARSRRRARRRTPAPAPEPVSALRPARRAASAVAVELSAALAARVLADAAAAPRASTPLPPVAPGFDAATGAYEERDSFAGAPATPPGEGDDADADADENAGAGAGTDENAAPGAGAETALLAGLGGGAGLGRAGAARRRAERARNFEYAPYHPCGWAGRLPGPAVVGGDLTNYSAKDALGGAGAAGAGGEGRGELWVLSVWRRGRWGWTWGCWAGGGAGGELYV
ncbi:hypothetical protein DFH11DRAFT_1793618 [Phellopilus nigrolimitatus]|nr:hypothetical protein DFH11DRAFT_1793618 [Phellopilus nigrolimitatus]